MTGILSFNSDLDRFGLLVCDLWEIEGFHCGECFDYWDSFSDKWIPTRLEYRYQPFSLVNNNSSSGWYLVGTSLSGDDLEGLKVKV